ncbi:class I SAM-dependent RNA methyltransferase [Aliiroseovarius sp. Z3]|uniref:class I SAM-dependent RNA methyltransferase n=1 Tax=Aliiroseovarius sp. Z3 TaxID=2811402 RepID=UPI0023B23A52|nr:class I SAM-dependent RNA methyltransferase [Aliiroseovarius sp. Z3]MDE9450131.1 class I SAM-dependent RNA methyltransferase [Aliiroseovarius sp. Z3]
MTKTYTIERLGHLGDGIAPGPVFAPRCLPGEEISGDVVDGRIAAPRIMTPSPDRVKAPCPHYNACGGCALLHASDQFVADWKVGVVKAALDAHGLTSEFRPIMTSPAASRRRAVLSGRRGKKGAIVGFHGRRSDTITEITSCQLVHPDILAALPALGALTMLGASRKGALSINVVQSASGLDVSVTGGKPLDRGLETDLAQALHTYGLARLTWDGEVIATETPPEQLFGIAAVVPPAGAFLQATRAGEAALLDGVREIVGGAKSVIDLFAGCGTFALPLAQAAEVHAVEGHAAMTDALALGWRQTQGLRHVTTEVRDLFRNPLMAEDLARFDAAVIDPPRAGAEAQIAQLAASDIKRIAMVSCNAQTFARDAKALVDAGYRMNWVQVVDQFRWSTHTEQVASFTRA